MGVLVDGVWHDKGYDQEKREGRFERDESLFRNWVTADGSAGPSGQPGFKAERGRYHLYAAYFCPWAHRTLIMRKLKGLEGVIDLSITNWLMREDGITFRPDDGVIPDPIHHADFLWQVYKAAKADYSGRVTVPVLWDKRTKTIVSNESADIIRMMNASFDGVGARGPDYYPSDLRHEIDVVNALVYDTVNNGVYKAGFATTQRAYEAAVVPLFETLDLLDHRLRRPALPDRRRDDRGRHQAGHHVAALRHRLCRAFQVQHSPHRRLPGPVGLPRRPVRHRRRRIDLPPRPHQEPLLPEPPVDQSDRGRAGRAGERPRRTGAWRDRRAMSAAPTSGRDPYESEAPIRVGTSAREQIETRWGLILVIFMRLLAAMWVLQGLWQWSQFLLPANEIFDDLTMMQSGAIMFFAVIDLLAAVGLWLATPWGGVLWLLAAVSQIFVSVSLRHMFGISWILADVTLILIYFTLTWQAGKVADASYIPVRSKQPPLHVP